MGYTSVGTFEFLLDRQDRFWFLEANCRIQVEHPITEAVTGIDLVKLQLGLAAGARLGDEYRGPHGHAIECRVTRKTRSRFAPDAGTIETLLLPGGPGIRVDTHVFAGYRFPPTYDSLLAKIIAWGRDRDEALARMARALRETRVEGIKTNLAFLRQVIGDEAFLRGGVGVGYRPGHDALAALAQAT